MNLLLSRKPRENLDKNARRQVAFWVQISIFESAASEKKACGLIKRPAAIGGTAK